MIVNSGEIPIDIDEDKFPFTNHLCPTPKELRMLTINWIVPFTPAALEKSTCKLGAARNLEVSVDDDKDYEPKIQTDTSRSVQQNPIPDSGPLAALAYIIDNFLKEL